MGPVPQPQLLESLDSDAAGLGTPDGSAGSSVAASWINPELA
jgi:hypothetical protein